MSKRQRAGNGESAHGQHTSAEAKQAVVPLNPAFKQRFGPVGEALAQELTAFSLDIVGIVAAYVVCGVATAGAKPQLLFSFSQGESGYIDGIATSSDGSQIWAASYLKVVVFDADGKHLFTIQNEQLKHPVGIAFASTERLFIASYSGNSVAELQSDGSVLRDIGRGLLLRPISVAVRADELFVTDSVTRRVDVFNTTSGELERSFGSNGIADGQFQRPWGVVAAAGEVFVSDSVQDCIQVFKLDGTFLRKFGSVGKGPGQFSAPCGMAIDRAGNLLVCEADGKRVQVLTPQASFITEFGKDMGQELFGVHVDREGRILVGDGNARIHVFAFAV